MAWLWNSWDEYAKYVNPVVVHGHGRVHQSQRDSWVETEHHLWKAVDELKQSAQSLHDLGFTGSDHDRPPDDPSIIEQARRLVLSAVYAGEELLLYHKRLALSEAAYGFLHQNDMLDHWSRYASSGRIPNEIHQLLKDIGELLQGYYELVQAEDTFLVGNIDLPDQLEADFRLARNLFSVGFDEVGLLIAGRGLEGVLREIADVRKISIDVKGKISPAGEADIYDLIEAMFHVRWITNKNRLITQETKTLLHYLRILRNSGAHARTNRQVVSPREKAVVVAETANRLWNDVSSKRARLTSVIQKTW